MDLTLQKLQKQKSTFSLNQKKLTKKYVVGQMLLIIDNLDSFTYNLSQYFQILYQDVKVLRCDQTSINDCLKLSPSHLVISPGPGKPEDAKNSQRLIETFCGKIPVFGVCLGLQCLAVLFGGKVIRAKKAIHGKTSAIFHQNKGVFTGLPQGFAATRYHSLIVEPSSLPKTLEITAQTKDGEIMGLRHKEFALEGVQFHPESILTKTGMHILKNFINLSQTYQEVI
jgi:anthranilate synthase/aminodeoxychorismate synthase-like glutamine amidotransferase